MISRLYLLALAAYQSHAAPAANSSQIQSTLYNASASTVPITSMLSDVLTSLSNHIDTTISLVISSGDSSNTVPITSTTPRTSSSRSTTSFASLPIPTIFVTEVITAFQTPTVNTTPSSTSFVIIVATKTETTATATTTTTTSTTAASPSWDTRTLWAAPPEMTDLTAFNITYFPSGQQNLRIVSEIPATAMSSTAKLLQGALQSTPSTFLQLVYPAHSVNPGSKPEGGADFYATPLNLSGARNVTLEYSVYFPPDFEWVKGGKLPGLFGGHTGCSGGASARDCFSTRLMWRPQGVGELYLYAPKDKQSDTLCADIGSVCDATYGFSIGRGAFNFTAADWTHLSQSVVLNTPGRNDGAFTLIANGRSVIDRTDILYRDVAQPSGNQPAEFLGLFFSTFFGGHGEQYATPKQQYTWFKDFAIIRSD